MQSKPLLGTLLLLLSAIGFISCSDDDKSDYHLKLSDNSCEVMQGRSASIGLTAHENTALNIESPELTEAVYAWQSRSFASKIEITGKLKGETGIVVTDLETGVSATIRVKVTEYPMPLLGVKQAKGNIFDRTDFYLYTQESQSINFDDLSAVCDSMVWTADGLKGSFKLNHI